MTPLTMTDEQRTNLPLKSNNIRQLATVTFMHDGRIFVWSSNGIRYCFDMTIHGTWERCQYHGIEGA